MTAYWDALNKQVAATARICVGPAPAYGVSGFIECLMVLEAEVVEIVRSVIDDPEFPADLRVRILETVKTQQARVDDNLYPTPGLQMSEVLKKSVLFSDLHGIFHDVARRRFKTRFGLLTDSPEDILKDRRAYEAEQVQEEHGNP